MKDALRQLIDDAGLELRECTAKHWQVLGGHFRVNVYPTTGKLFINGTKRAISFVTVDEVIEAALRPPEKTGKPRREMSGKKKRAVKTRLLAKSDKCHWCNTQIAFETATIDHVIPIARDGSNQGDNLVLACGECNSERGSDMPEAN